MDLLDNFRQLMYEISKTFEMFWKFLPLISILLTLYFGYLGHKKGKYSKAFFVVFIFSVISIYIWYISYGWNLILQFLAIIISILLLTTLKTKSSFLIKLICFILSIVILLWAFKFNFHGLPNFLITNKGGAV